MAISIELSNKTYIIEQNENISYEIIEDEACFFIESTNKMLVMNASCYELWKLICDRAFKNTSLEKDTIIEFKEIKDILLEKFDFDDNQIKNLEKDIDIAMYYYINEKVFLERDTYELC